MVFWLSGIAGLAFGIVVGLVGLFLMADPLFKIITFIVALIILIKFLRGK